MSTPMTDPTRLHEEVVQVARDLIRCDTTNAREPGLGNETLCAEYLRDYLAGHGASTVVMAERETARTMLAHATGATAP